MTSSSPICGGVQKCFPMSVSSLECVILGKMFAHSRHESALRLSHILCPASLAFNAINEVGTLA